VLKRLSKFSLKRKASFGVLILILVLLAFVNFNSFDLLPSMPYFKLENQFPIFLISSLILSVLILLVIEKKHDFFSLFNFMWVFLISFFLCRIFFNYSNVRKLDYLFSKEITEYKLEQIKEGHRSQFHVFKFDLENKDRVYYSLNLDWEEIYTGEFKLYKSKFTNAYFLRKSE
jgi:hypothetical protein